MNNSIVLTSAKSTKHYFCYCSEQKNKHDVSTNNCDNGTQQYETETSEANAPEAWMARARSRGRRLIQWLIKKYFEKCDITLITSSKNYEYAKSLNLFDNVIEFPKRNIINKIKFIYNLNKKNFDYIYIFDGKERSILAASFIKSRINYLLRDWKY